MKRWQRYGKVKNLLDIQSSLCKGPGAEEFSQCDQSMSVKGRVAEDEAEMGV